MRASASTAAFRISCGSAPGFSLASTPVISRVIQESVAAGEFRV
jgi:hypothetical protein